MIIEAQSDDIIMKLREANHKEREYLLFKLFYHGLDEETKISLMNAIKKYPFIIDRVWSAIDEANIAKYFTEKASYNRNKYYEQIIVTYKELLTKMSKLADELSIHNSLELSVLFSYLLWNGYLSKTKTHRFKQNIKHPILGILFDDIMNGMGVCLNYSEMLKDFLNHSGYHSVVLVNYLGKIKIDYMMNVCERKMYTGISRNPSQKNTANHVFTLIEDNGLYIYDSTNLLLYSLRNQDYSAIINGKGRNILYPYYSHMFCYAKEDERMLDRLLLEKRFSCPYTKIGFMSTSEATLESIRNNTSLLDDFYIESKKDIVSIAEESKKIRARVIQ